MTTKHTPGPWVWNNQDQLLGPPSTARDQTTRWQGDSEVDAGTLIVETDSGVYPPRAADRALIAAAPEMREALQAFVDAFMTGPSSAPFRDAFTKACHAIAKADGVDFVKFNPAAGDR